jgi:hypothetical protein
MHRAAAHGQSLAPTWAMSGRVVVFVGSMDYKESPWARAHMSHEKRQAWPPVGLQPRYKIDTHCATLPVLPGPWPFLRLCGIAPACAEYRGGRKTGFSARARARAEPLDKVLRKSGNSAFRGFSAQRGGPETRILPTGSYLRGKPTHAAT